MTSIRKLLLPTLCASFLSMNACVPFVAGAAIGALVVYDQRTATTIKNDQKIGFHLNNELANKKEFPNSRLRAETFNYVVLLIGQAPTESLREQAEQLALRKGKVKRVYNQIVIGEPISVARQSKDAYLTTAVRTRMLATVDLKSGQIKLTTENGVVYLMGSVTARQANIATNAARDVAGVRKVVRLFEVNQGPPNA